MPRPKAACVYPDLTMIKSRYRFLKAIMVVGGTAEWSGEPVSPAICRLRVRFVSPLGHATLPTTGASVTVVAYGWTNCIKMAVT